MMLEILKYPDPQLRRVCRPVAEITKDIHELAANMLETMYAARGVGLAAPQVGIDLRMLVMDPGMGTEELEPRVIINPALELAGELITSEQEGCLSVPMNYRADVPRYSKVRLKGLDLQGKPLDEELEGFAAIIVQHETDHLDGKLFIDKMSHLKRAMYDNKVKKWQKHKSET